MKNNIDTTDINAQIAQAWAELTDAELFEHYAFIDGCSVTYVVL